MPDRGPARGRGLADARRANRTLVDARRAATPAPVLVLWATVDAHTSTTVDLDVGGSDIMTGVPFAASYSPTDGDRVRVEDRNNVWFVTGKAA